MDTSKIKEMIKNAAEMQAEMKPVIEDAFAQLEKIPREQLTEEQRRQIHEAKHQWAKAQDELNEEIKQYGNS